MTTDFISLPDLPLLRIFSYLPVWKILELSLLCQRLYKIKQETFRNGITHLKILICFNVNQSDITKLKSRMRFFQTEHQDFDMVFNIGFAKKPNQRILPYLKADEIDHDLVLKNAQQISSFAESFPKVKHLTLAMVNSYFDQKTCSPYNWATNIISKWPNLEQLYLICDVWDVNWKDVLMQINKLDLIKEVAIDCHSSSIRFDADDSKKLLRKKEHLLNSLIVKSCFTIANAQIAEDEGQAGSLIIYLNQATSFVQLENVSLYELSLKKEISDCRLVPKCTRLETSIDDFKSFFDADLTKWHHVRWLNLQLTDSNEGSLEQLLTKLAQFTQLHELKLDLLYTKIVMPKKKLTDKLPSIASVRDFHLLAHFEPHHLCWLKNVFPNAAKMTLQIGTDSFSIENDSLFDKQFTNGNLENDLCKRCIETMKRGLSLYGTNVDSFYWTYDRDNEGHKLESQVGLFTRKVAGKRRINFDRISI